ncbi:hypothetical protein Pen02_46960 [Plantactinospora endophytica]|uniref:Uncharacterized protein n=1 Tax=Plantactinospora endophytica TaxID=673535 RepID=A0ABQ4E4Z5_9ACTN|nr:hypothetical protein Pen02_46960 [Plantactinospora endophytica]
MIEPSIRTSRPGQGGGTSSRAIDSSAANSARFISQVCRPYEDHTPEPVQTGATTGRGEGITWMPPPRFVPFAPPIGVLRRAR